MVWCSFASPSENIVMFEVDRVVRKDVRSSPARHYLFDIVQFCPRGVGVAVVTRIKFRRSSKSPNHTFLLVYVKDCKVPGLSAVVRIERHGHRTPADTSDGQNISPLSLDCIQGIPLPFSGDIFTIAPQARITSSDEILSTLVFSDGSSLTAERVAMICEVVSDSASEYSVATTQCSWYAATIYEIVQSMQTGQFRKEPTMDDRRMHMHYGLDIEKASNVSTPLYQSPHRLTERYLNQWDEWKADVEKTIQVHFPSVVC
ncbi:hypothetical protein F5146DRAFT_1068655, partial [Armillaria mellea]